MNSICQPGLVLGQPEPHRASSTLSNVSFSTDSPGVPVDLLCQNSGICTSVGNTHRCQCAVGYTGSYCEEQLNECVSNPCKHGATCIDFIGGYRCEVGKMSGQRSLSASEGNLVANMHEWIVFRGCVFCPPFIKFVNHLDSVLGSLFLAILLCNKSS